MRRILSLLTVVVTALALTVIPTGSASAIGGESLRCRIVPVTGNPPFTQFCSNRLAVTGTYSAGFHVFDTVGAYSVSWTLPSGYVPAFGCDNSFDCSVNMSSRFDQDLPVSVTLTQNGVSVTLTARAHINAVCGSQLC